VYSLAANQMIKVKLQSGKQIIINAELIESVEARPHTTITLISGNRFVVQETPEEIRRLVVEYRKEVVSAEGKQ